MAPLALLFSLADVSAHQVFGVLFTAAGAVKLLSRADFVVIVQSYDLLPRGMVRPVATILPWVEVGLGILLILPTPGARGRALALFSVSVTLTLFAVSQAVNLLRGRSLPCGCFGTSEDSRFISWRTVSLNMAGAAVAAVLFRIGQSEWTLDLGVAQQLSVRSGATACLLLLVARTQLTSNQEFLEGIEALESARHQ